MTAYGNDHSEDQATRALLAAWALDALDEGERARVEELMARDERAAAEAASFLATMAAVDEGLEQLPPRPELRETVLRRVAATPQGRAPADAPSSPSAPRGTDPAPHGEPSAREQGEVVPLSRYRSSVRRGRWLGLAAAILLITTVASFGLWRGERAADDVELAEIETPQSDSAPAEGSVTVQDDLAGSVQIGVTVEPSTGSQEPTSDPIAAAEL